MSFENNLLRFRGKDVMGRRAALLALAVLALLPVGYHSIRFSGGNTIRAIVQPNNGDIRNINQPRKPKLTRELSFEALSFPPSEFLRYRDGSVFGFGDNFFVDFKAVFDVAKTGLFTFTVSSDDGFRLTIDDNVVSSHPGDRPLGVDEVKVALEAGRHTLLLQYFQRYGPASVEAFYQMSGDPMRHAVGESSGDVRFLPLE
ncbi:MAG: PA14 domain-containing protein [Bdellovibrionota bacterium]